MNLQDKHELRRSVVSVVLENRGGHDGVATGGHYGSYARIWTNRPNAVAVRIVDEKHSTHPGRLTYHNDTIVAEVEVTDSFDPERDYVVVEHKRSPNPHMRGASHREGYSLLFGKMMPGWADFPERWKDWVNDYEVRNSAIDYIIKRVPSAESLVEYACRKTSKGRIADAWDDVRAECERALGRKIDISPRNGGWTWTYVRSMPIRIAMRLGGWRPPKQMPRYEGRGSDAVLVADEHGVRAAR